MVENSLVLYMVWPSIGRAAFLLWITGTTEFKKFENNGNFILLWGNFGSANGNFNNPTGIACDAKGDVYVADTNNQPHPKVRWKTWPLPHEVRFAGETVRDNLIPLGG